MKKLLTSNLSGSGAFLFVVLVLVLGCRVNLFELDPKPGPAKTVTNWSKAFGFGDEELVSQILPLPDQGSILIGSTYSFSQNFTLDADIFLLRLDKFGNTIWQKCYGGSKDDFGKSICSAPDGGFVIAGFTNSYHTYGDGEPLIMKVTSNGDLVWQKIFKDKEEKISIADIRNDRMIIKETTDPLNPAQKGFIVAIDCFEDSGPGIYTVTLVKLDTKGVIEWQKKYYRPNEVSLASLDITSDDQYIVTGVTRSFVDTKPDILLFKVNTTGNISWQKVYGEAVNQNEEKVYKVLTTSEGGFLIGGSTTSYGAGLDDGWIAKLDNSGNIIWQTAIGTDKKDEIIAFQETVSDTYQPEFIVFGNTVIDGKAEAWIVKLNLWGSFMWQKLYGGESNDYAIDLVKKDNKHFITAGVTHSYGSALLEFGYGEGWVFNIDSGGNSIHPHVEWEDVIFTPNEDVISVIALTADPGSNTRDTKLEVITSNFTATDQVIKCYDIDFISVNFPVPTPTPTAIPAST